MCPFNDTESAQPGRGRKIPLRAAFRAPHPASGALYVAIAHKKRTGTGQVRIAG